MSKAQKGNKENKKPKADKNRVKSVSAYKAAQSLGKPASSQFGKKTWRSRHTVAGHFARKGASARKALRETEGWKSSTLATLRLSLDRPWPQALTQHNRGELQIRRNRGGFPVVFDQNTLAGEWREQVRCCEEQDITLDRDIAFALAVADLLELPDDLPLLPAVTAAMSIPTCLRDPGSLAHLKAVAHSAAAAPTKLTADEDPSEKGSSL
jgi:hypothetical protein